MKLSISVLVLLVLSLTITSIGYSQGEAPPSEIPDTKVVTVVGEGSMVYFGTWDPLSMFGLVVDARLLATFDREIRITVAKNLPPVGYTLSSIRRRPVTHTINSDSVDAEAPADIIFVKKGSGL